MGSILAEPKMLFEQSEQTQKVLRLLAKGGEAVCQR